MADSTEKIYGKRISDLIDKAIDTLAFENKNPFTDEEIKSWDLELANHVIWIFTPSKKYGRRWQDKYDKAVRQTITRIKDLHGII